MFVGVRTPGPPRGVKGSGLPQNFVVGAPRDRRLCSVVVVSAAEQKSTPAHARALIGEAHSFRRRRVSQIAAGGRRQRSVFVGRSVTAGAPDSIARREENAIFYRRSIETPGEGHSRVTVAGACVRPFDQHVCDGTTPTTCD